MTKIKIDPQLLTRVEDAAQKAGYSSVEEFIMHALETELQRLREDEAEEQVADQLRGLGYLE